MKLSLESQREIVKGILSSADVCRGLHEVLEPASFDQPDTAGLIAKIGLTLFHTNGAPATKGQVRDAVEALPIPSGVKQKIHEAHGEILAADRTTDEWCVEQGRLLTAQNHILTTDVRGLAESGDFVKILNRAQEAATIVAPPGDLTVGAGTPEALAARHNVKFVACPTGIGWLDVLLGGGLHQGRFGAWLAEKGGGKSQALTQVGAAAAMAGFHVLDVSGEMPEWEKRARYDRHFSGRTREEVLADPEGTHEMVKDISEMVTIYESTDRPITPYAIAGILDRQKVKTQVLVVDYAQLMTSGTGFQGESAHRRDMEATAIAMRRLAQKRKLFYWTAYQANRQGAKKNDAGDELIDKTDVAGCYDALWHADVIVSLNQTLMESKQGKGRLYLSDNRGGECKRMSQLNFDWARSRITETI